ncbi:MAG: glycoside hydrolase family 5 protein [Treponema sp.]|jgi:endoglucanase|nr:glycoside hydrolase family 5 protein [Treponema sp.]
MNNIPFSKGVNFSKWFESRTFDDIVFETFTEKDFINVKSLGADVIRIPIAFHRFTMEDSSNTINPKLFSYIDSAVDWAEKHQIYLIIDNHSFHPVNPTDPNIDKILIPVWKQIADRYKNRSKYIIYEILNEPHKIDDELWGRIQGDTINAVRQIDNTHLIIVGGTDYNSIEKLFTIPEYKDDKLIYTFHFYDPHIFTHQGATWNKPSLAPLSNLSFPYDNKLPEIHETFVGTWVESAIKGYEADSKYEKLNATLDKVLKFSKERNVPVFCGEFGVLMIQSPKESRVRWYQFICGELNKRKISWTCWDYYGSFGIFNSPDYKSNFETDLNIEVIQAMGFTV